MLWALWLEEGHAAALLEALGVRRDQLELTIVVDTDSSVALDAESMSEGIIQEARQFVRLFEQSGELTSEHLLLALTCQSETELGKLGITRERLVELIYPDRDTTSLPVAPEYQLSDAAPQPDSDRGVQPIVSADKPPSLKPTLDEPIQAYRAIDAAANRAREGLRVVEDYVRFGLNDRILIGELKSCRHNLAEALNQLDPTQLIRSRDTVGDQGTTVTTSHEYTRGSLESIAIANMKRVQEAMRTLEEFLKYVDTSGIASARIEQTRYRSYTLEKALATTIAANQTFAGRVLYMLVTESLCRQPWKDVVLEALASGVNVVQLREKSLSDAEIIERGHWLRRETSNAGALLIMNDRPDLAVAVSADGVHVGQEEMSVNEARQILGPAALVGVSTHNLDQARNAVLDGADYLGVGPVFQTKTKRFQEYAGTAYVAEVASHTSLPWFAIGGIGPANLKEAILAGASRIAVSGTICGAHDVKKETKQMAQRLLK
jgi:thiamine-phosphate pyrophosphorylase